MKNIGDRINEFQTLGYDGMIDTSLDECVSILFSEDTKEIPIESLSVMRIKVTGFVIGGRILDRVRVDGDEYYIKHEISLYDISDMGKLRDITLSCINGEGEEYTLHIGNDIYDTMLNLMVLEEKYDIVIETFRNLEIQIMNVRDELRVVIYTYTPIPYDIIAQYDISNLASCAI